ncbi:MAG: hypothetical protein NC247_02330 [Ruminococcus flavefaciens]|nr:hypothetical protein [Ruminococcus flavefaciens]
MNEIYGVQITTSNDIWIELNGQRIAGVQSYSTKYTNDVKTVDAFGQDIPIGWTRGKKAYSLDLTKVYLEDTAIADGIDFYSLSDGDFDLVIVKNGRRTVYKNCIVSSISEDGNLNDKVQEKMSLTAHNRIREN